MGAVVSCVRPLQRLSILTGVQADMTTVRELVRCHRQLHHGHRQRHRIGVQGNYQRTCSRCAHPPLKHS